MMKLYKGREGKGREGKGREGRKNRRKEGGKENCKFFCLVNV